MSDNFVVHSIKEDQIEPFASILKDAAEWLHQNGQKMWTPEQITVERLLKQNAIHEMFIGYYRGEAAAAMIIQETDLVMWPEETKNHDSLYLHKLCVRRAKAKTGSSTAMIQWAMEEVLERNKTYLRLDCAADRPKLCAFYEMHGFKKVGERLVQHKYPTAFFEWKIEIRQPNDRRVKF